MHPAQRRRFPWFVAVSAGMGLVFLQANGGLAATPGEAGKVDSNDPPTFYTDVLPILQRSCQACHQPAGLNLGGMVAPMSFMTYQETRPWAPIIAKAVKERRMPPWHASEMHRGKFVNERYIEEAEIETLIAWAEAGAPAGAQPAGWTPPVVISDSEHRWALGEPDLIIRLDEPFLVEDDVSDLYVTVYATLTEEMLPQDRWIKSVEYRVGPTVHHILGGVGGLAPGYEPEVYGNGYGRLLQKGPRRIGFDMHYNKQPGPGTAVWDHTEVGIRFMEPGEVIKYVTGGDNLGMTRFLIPAGHPSYSSSMEHTFEKDVYITRFNPHMHLRGKAALYEITYPDGRHEVLLHVPRYDFNWQHRYTFAEPVLAPAGSKIRLTLWWDNSANNPNNPDPTVDVRWGQPTTAEMAYGFMQYREVEERHIVVGEELASDVVDSLTGRAADDHPDF